MTALQDSDKYFVLLFGSSGDIVFARSVDDVNGIKVFDSFDEAEQYINQLFRIIRSADPSTYSSYGIYRFGLREG